LMSIDIFLVNDAGVQSSNNELSILAHKNCTIMDWIQ